MSVLSSGLNKIVTVLFVAVLAAGIPQPGYAQSKANEETSAGCCNKKERKARRAARKERKAKAKEMKHQEIIHGSENDAELEKIKAEKNKQKGIK